MKNTVKKNYLPFAAGMLTMVLLAVLVSATLAKNETHSGQISPEVSYGQVGVGLFLREQVAARRGRTTITSRRKRWRKSSTWARGSTTGRN